MSPVGHAEEAILIPGAMPFKQINPIAPVVANTYPDIGKYFHADATPQLIEYSQDPLMSNRALRDGATRTIATARSTDGDLVIIGESMGSMVAWRAAEGLVGDQDAPARNVRVVLIAPPEAGVAEYFREGTYIPVLNYRITRIRDTGHPTAVVIGEYDGWSDPPDRPWNVIASANALAGIVYVHGPTSFTVDPADVPAQNITTRGSVTTYLAPTSNLPLTQVFRDVGVPDPVVDKADELLRPIVDAGYLRHDEPGDTRPYLRDGAIRRDVAGPQHARPPLRQRIARAVDDFRDRRAHRREARHDIRNASRDTFTSAPTTKRQRSVERQPQPHRAAAGDSPGDSHTE